MYFHMNCGLLKLLNEWKTKGKALFSDKSMTRGLGITFKKANASRTGSLAIKRYFCCCSTIYIKPLSMFSKMF